MPKRGCFLRMNSREMIGEFRSLRQALSGWLDSATLSLLIAGISGQDHALRRSQELCHNCDTKPFFTVTTDFIDDVRLLILRNLLKTTNWPTNPAYRLPAIFSMTYGRFNRGLTVRLTRLVHWSRMGSWASVDSVHWPPFVG